MENLADPENRPTQIPPARKYEGILFDFDGVLGKTMEDNYQAWAYSLAPYGIQVQREEYFLMEGAPARQVAETLLKKNHRGLEFVDDIVRSKERHYLHNRVFSLYEGVRDLIDRLKKEGFWLGLVTGASRQRILGTGINQFLKQFDVLVTGDQVRKGKPDPEPYLLGARKLNLPPDRCLVVENAPLGIESAKKAGMYCLAVCTTLAREHLSLADQVLETIAELPAYLS